MKVEANLAITRENGVLSFISLVLPVWIKCEDIFSISIPMFHLKTFAKNESEIQVAVEEAVKSFCIAAEKFGRGLEAELGELGWSKEDSDLSFNLPQSDVMQQIIETAETFAFDHLSIDA